MEGANPHGGRKVILKELVPAWSKGTCYSKMKQTQVGNCIGCGSSAKYFYSSQGKCDSEDIASPTRAVSVGTPPRPNKVRGAGGPG